jgi:hypothetical protein
LVGVEAVLFLAHVFLLYFVHSLLFGLFFEVEGVLFFIEGGPFLPEDAADEAVVGLLRVGSALFLFAVVVQLHLLLEGVPHLDVSPLLLLHFLLHAFGGLFVLLHQNLVYEFALEIAVLPHLLLVEIAVVVVDLFVLLVLLALFGAVLECAVLVVLVQLVQLELLLAGCGFLGVALLALAV